MLSYVLFTVVFGILFDIAIVTIMAVFDPSPTRDDLCRGGHDF